MQLVGIRQSSQQTDDDQRDSHIGLSKDTANSAWRMARK